MKLNQLIVLHGYLILNFAGVFALNAQTPLTIFPLKDNTLIEDAAGALSIGKSENFFVGRTAQETNSIRRGLIAFDIAADVPQGAKINSISLVLYMSQTQAGSEEIRLHRISSDWGEGKSVAFGGQGAPADSGDATWIHTFHDTVFWTNAGGDFSIISSASQIVGGNGFYVWESGQMDADVQDWLDPPRK